MRIGIIGFGFMGRAHLEQYQTMPRARVVAVAARHLESLADASGAYSNIEGVGQSPLDTSGVRLTTDWRELVAMRDVDVVDVCAPTPAHLEIVKAALQAGKHVLCEKPVGRTLKETQQIAAAAARAKGFFMSAMVMRFWPEWAWLKQVAQKGRYGRILSATFQRLSPLPPKTRWTRDGKASGGALLDLHVHDTDFIYWLFGMPRAVFSRAYSFVSGEADHVLTQYVYDKVPLVTAEGGWTLDDGMKFAMRYRVKFERATAEFDLSRKPALLVAHKGLVEQPRGVIEGSAYRRELAYFLECVRHDERPDGATAQDAVRVMRIITAEQRSVGLKAVVECR